MPPCTLCRAPGCAPRVGAGRGSLTGQSDRRRPHRRRRCRRLSPPRRFAGHFLRPPRTFSIKSTPSLPWRAPRRARPEAAGLGAAAPRGRAAPRLHRMSGVEPDPCQGSPAAMAGACAPRRPRRPPLRGCVIWPRRRRRLLAQRRTQLPSAMSGEVRETAGTGARGPWEGRGRPPAAARACSRRRWRRRLGNTPTWARVRVGARPPPPPRSPGQKQRAAARVARAMTRPLVSARQSSCGTILWVRRAFLIGTTAQSAAPHFTTRISQPLLGL